MPDVLLTTPNVEVVHGAGPGKFYCAHIFFITQKEAHKRGSLVVNNAQGEKLVGFLHVPNDMYADGTNSNYTQAERHKGTREVVGFALRGYYTVVSAQCNAGPIKIQVNGFGNYGSAKNNPAGDFVLHRENLDVAMRHAFDDLLITPNGQTYAQESGGNNLVADTWQYVVQDPQSHKRRTVLIYARCFPITDDAINGQEGVSVQSAMKHFKPGVLLIASGDREDIVLAAGTALFGQSDGLAGIVLTGGLRPGPALLKVIEKMPFPVLLASEDSYAVASKVHDLIVKTRPNETQKITVIRDLVAQYVDVDRIMKAL